MQAEKLFLNKLNVILVQILKQVRPPFAFCCFCLHSLALLALIGSGRPSPTRLTGPPPKHRPTPQEWPHNWPNFISDIVAFSQTSEVLCENNIRILKLLSEGACVCRWMDGWMDGWMDRRRVCVSYVTLGIEANGARTDPHAHPQPTTPTATTQRCSTSPRTR